MFGEELKETLKKIEMPLEMQERIIRRCVAGSDQEELKMIKIKRNVWFKGASAVAAAAAVCLCVSFLSVAALRSGYFKNITDWTGAVTGGVYEHADNEIRVKAAADGEELNVHVWIDGADQPPFIGVEDLAVDSYRILTAEGETVFQGESTQLAALTDGYAEIAIPLSGLKSGSYKLVIDAFRGEAKADQPLPIKGTWECDFEF